MMRLRRDPKALDLLEAHAINGSRMSPGVDQQLKMSESPELPDLDAEQFAEYLRRFFDVDAEDYYPPPIGPASIWEAATTVALEHGKPIDDLYGLLNGSIRPTGTVLCLARIEAIGPKVRVYELDAQTTDFIKNFNFEDHFGPSWTWGVKSNVQ